MAPKIRPATAVAILCCLLSSAFASKVCYYPNGKLPGDGVANIVPCKDTEEDVSCCSNNDACLANGLCWGGDVGLVYRGGCTDPSWNTSNCPNYCNDENPDKWSNLWPKPGGWWCAENDFDGSLGTTASTFAWPTPGSVFTVIGHTSPTPSSVASSLVRSGTSSQTSTITSSGSALLPVAAAQTGASSPSATSPPSPSSSNNNNLATALGAGIGVPLGVLVLGILAFLFWRHNKNSSNKAKQLSDSPPQWPQPNAYPPEKRGITPYFTHEMAADSQAQELQNGRAGVTQELDSRYKTVPR